MTWCLVGNTGVLHMLDNSMMFVGRENCEINIQSRSVDKRHSVLNYDQIDEIFSVKDMSTVNGTFVNETRIPDQTYMTLQQGDTVRFGYDPVTYRFDQIDPTQIRQVKDALGVTRLEYNVEENGNNNKPVEEVEEKELVGGAATETEEAFLERSRGARQHLSADQAGPTDNGHSRQRHRPDMIPSPRGSPLYGQPEWWGEPDVDDDEGFRCRSGTYDAPTKDKRNNQEPVHTERPTKLALGDNARDIPVHIYTRRPDIKPTTPKREQEPPDNTNLTLVKASERHVGFTIEFNPKEDSPKMSKKESLQDFVPVTVKNKINENKRIVEELKAERRSKKGDDPDSLQSPVQSPSPSQDKKHGRRRSGSNETPANRNKANQSATKSSHKRQPSSTSENMNGTGDGGDGADNVSEAGTYTIESDSKDVVEARNRIDEVFGVNGSMEDLERGSEEDTDKDISDEEIVEEAISRDFMPVEHAGYHRKGHGKTPDADLPHDVYVAQWTQDAGVLHAQGDGEEMVEDSSGTTPSNSTVIKNDLSPDKELSSPMRTPANRRSGKGRRMLPTTPVERQEQGDSPRHNGIHPSQGSAFHSPRNEELEETHEEPVRDNHVSPRNGGISYTPRRNQVTSALHQPRPPMEPRNSWEQEGEDTEMLLKDTETYMKNLELKMQTKSRESPSPEPDVSEALSHRDFDADVDTDLESASHVASAGKGLHAKRGSNGSLINRTGIPTKKDSQPEQLDSKGKPVKPKSTMWSRLSQPNKHKRSTTASDKESSLMSDNQSDTENSAFQRNTSITASLPVRRMPGRKTPSKEVSSSNKKESKKDSKKEAKPKPKADLSKPRQTRSTMLRKSKNQKDDKDQSDISPTSSISDLSSSKPSNFKKYGSSRDANKSSSKAAPRSSKPVQSKVDYGRARPSAASSGKGSGTDTSASSHFTRNTRLSQSYKEGRSNAGETSSRLMSKISASKQPSSSRRSSISSNDGTAPPSNVRKSSSSGWRKYQGDSDNDGVDAYIQSVNTRRSASASSYEENKAKSSSMHNLNHKGQPQQQQGNVQTAGKLGDEIAHVSSSLAQSLQRLTKMTQGDPSAEAALESLPKEEKVMDELFSEDAVFLPKSHSNTSANVAPRVDDSSGRLQRAASLSLYPDDNLAQAMPPHVVGGSPPAGLKHKNLWGKTNESFDNLVLSSVNHLSLKLKDSSDRIAYKLKVLQSPNASEEELADAVKESEFALLKTGNKEIASILRNMRQMEKRLADIHTMIDPRNEIQLPKELSPAAQIRRKYIGEYGNLSSSGAATTNSILKSPSSTHPRQRNWSQRSSTTGGGRSVFSDGEDVEVYL